MVRTTNGYNSLSLALFSEALNVITGNMTGNANFPDQQTLVSTIVTEQGKFQQFIQKAASGTKVEIMFRDEKRSLITDLLHQLGNEVTAVANGATIMLESSGINFTQPRKPSAPLEKPEPPKVSPGINNGELVCVAKPQPGMKSIVFMLSNDPTVETNWKIFTSSTSKFLFENLEGGKRYFFKYKLAGVRNQEVVSDVVSYIPQ